MGRGMGRRFFAVSVAVNVCVALLGGCGHRNGAVTREGPDELSALDGPADMLSFRYVADVPAAGPVVGTTEVRTGGATVAPRDVVGLDGPRAGGTERCGRAYASPHRLRWAHGPVDRGVPVVHSHLLGHDGSASNRPLLILSAALARPGFRSAVQASRTHVSRDNYDHSPCAFHQFFEYGSFEGAVKNTGQARGGGLCDNC